MALLEPGPVEPGDPRPLAPPAPVELGADVGACLKRLRNLGVSFTRLPPISPGGACHVPVPLEVASLGSGVAITPAAVMNCRTAEGLALWIRDSLVPASRRYLEAVPTSIVHDSAYVCRARNNAPGGRLSEHATANAVDIASIRFAARPPLAIGRVRGVAEARFEAAIRRESCTYFTTVLGPGSNAAHATHFHFDAAQRRGGYRLCDLGAKVAGRAP
ncbi:MAG TPA: extensin family protein [Propylenella sp.]|nr:extensin family protein [Propylenella sp.]